MSTAAASNTNLPEVQYLDEAQAASYAGCSRPWLRALRQKGSTPRVKAPAHIKIGRKVLYAKSDLDAWLASYRVSR